MRQHRGFARPPFKTCDRTPVLERLPPKTKSSDSTPVLHLCRKENVRKYNGFARPPLKTCDGTSGLSVYQQHRATLQQFCTSVENKTCDSTRVSHVHSKKRATAQQFARVQTNRATVHEFRRSVRTLKTQKPNPINTIICNDLLEETRPLICFDKVDGVDYLSNSLTH